MQTFLSLLIHLGVIIIIMLLYYFVPAIVFCYEFYIRNKSKWWPVKIQEKYPDKKQVRREIRTSLVPILIFSLAGLLMYECAIRGYTKVYFSISDYGWLYFVLSFVINVFVNDTIFYWAHRFMHLKWVFPHIHLTHHRSTSPTPFDVLAFHPGEAIIHASVYVLLIFIIPVHPVMFSIFHGYNLISNVAGHGGHEIMTEKQRNHWLFNSQNTVTNHDVHHKKFNCYYGNYFIIWDMLMGTLEKKPRVSPENKRDAAAGFSDKLSRPRFHVTNSEPGAWQREDPVE